MKIGIFGGSFNPIHKGHIKLANFAIKNLNLDKLIYVPNSKNPFKNKILDGNIRIEMIKAILDKNSDTKTQISDFEVKKSGTSYTIDTIKYFKNKYPNDKLFFLLGTDNLKKISKWKNINLISEMATLCFFKRNEKFSKINIKKYNGILLNNPIYNYSSTNFKNLCFDDVELKVREYIGKNFLYTKEILFSMMNGDKKRHKHSVETAKLSAIYAKKNNFDIKIAWFAGLFHDITKTKNLKWHKDFLNKYDYKNLQNFELHQNSGAFWIRDVYMCKNEDIFNAIKIHTTLNDKLNILDKIVYAADKLCEGRAWEGIQNVRKLILDDFEKGFKKIVKITFDRERQKHGKLSKEAELIYKRWT